MKRNEGTVDRIVRIVIGAVLLAVGIWGGVTGALMWVLVVLGIIGLVTGIIGWCCLYAVCGWSTYKAAAPPPAEQKPQA